MFSEKVKADNKENLKEVLDGIEDENVKMRYTILASTLYDSLGQKGVATLTLILKLITTSNKEIEEALDSIESDVDCIQYLLDTLSDLQILILVSFMSNDSEIGEIIRDSLDL